MIDFSKVSQKSLLGKISRGLLKLIPQNSVLPILQGRLKGKKWIIGSGVFGYWLGIYELKKQRFFERTVKEGDTIYDIGAHVGFYTLLAAAFVGEKGKVFSFEPNPRNIFYLKRHIKINNYKNIKVFETAVSESSGTASFSASENSFSGQFSESGKLEVKTVALDDLINIGEILPPDIIKIDVEGAEAAVLKGAAKLIEKYHPAIFLATHNEKARGDCLRFLRLLGYNLKAVIGENIEKADEIFAYF